MRKILMLSTAALLVSVSAAAAQQVNLNLGYRGLSADGDQARLERFRDLRSGPIGSGFFKSENEKSVLTFGAQNIGYHDQKYTVDYNNFGKLKLSGSFNSIPLNYSYNTLTPWVNAGNNVWTLDPAARTAVQNKTALGIDSTAADYNTASIYRSLANPFSMQSRRDILNVGAKYRLTNLLGFNVGFTSTKRGGTMPFGGSFAFNNGNEHPVLVDDRNNDITAGLEWAKPSTGMVRVQWLNSHYKNQYLSMQWDNPLRATDYNNGKAVPAGPYDASGYSNGNGPAFGRLALPPSSSMNSFSLVGLHKLPSRTTINGSVAYTTFNQNADLIPWTTNSVINSPAVLAAFPGLKQLPRPTAEAEVRAVNAMLTLTTHPTDRFGLEMRYRFNDHENKTPAFDASNNVRFDAVPEAVPGNFSENYNIRHNVFETTGTFDVIPQASLALGYIMDDVKRTGRLFNDLTDYTLRATLDTRGNQFFTLRGIYENTHRKGQLNEEAVAEQGMQPGALFYDEAPFVRNKGVVILQVNPSEKFDVGFSLNTMKDKFDAEQTKGLLSNSTTGYDATLTVYPANKITFTGHAGRESYKTLQASGNVNPLGSPPAAYESWNDPNRNWNLDNNEKVTTLGASLDFLKALPNTDVRINYDYSKSDNAFVYGGPRIQELMTNTALTPGDGSPCGAGITSCFSQLPDVTNNWQTFRIDLTHNFNKTYGIGVGYSYEKLNIVDYATRDLANGTPRIDPLGAITTGYGNRPYTGNVFSIRLTYMLQKAPVM